MKAYFSTSTFYWLPTWRVLSRHLLTAVLIINLLGIFIYLTSTTSSYSTRIVIESCVLSNQSLNSSTSSKPTKEDNASGISLSPKIDIEKEAVNQTTTYPFEGFNNITGADHFIVPNIIHFIRFNKTEYSFVDYICLKAAFRNQNPDYIYVHTDVGDQFNGKYWDWIQNNIALIAKIRLIPIVVPTEIFGQKLNKEWQLYHGSDIARARVVMQYGGIYLDNDAFIIQNLDNYRKYEVAINWDENDSIGTQVIIAHKDSRFLKLWLESYRNNYMADKWYYNAGERPTKEILSQHPEIIHRVKGQFGVATGTSIKLYTDRNFNWRALDAIHLLINHRHYLDSGFKTIPVFDEKNITTYTFPFGEMARDIMTDP